MYWNYVKIALRNILRNKVFSFINILGLAIGLACFMLIFLWVRDETGYDRFHENAGQLYRLIQKDSANPEFIWTTTPTPLGPMVKEKIPEVRAVTRYWSTVSLVKFGDKVFFEDGIRLVDPDFFTMFTFPILQGNKESALPDLDAVVLTESTARKYFGEEGAVGKMLNIGDTLDLTVSAVVEDPPVKSHLRFSMLLHINHVPDYRLSSWASDYPAYVLISKDARPLEVVRKMEQVWRMVDPAGTGYSDLQNITEIYLNEYGSTGRIILVYTFSVIAVLVLLIACINFMNLSTARSTRRVKEVGLRKVAGARRSQLISQFIGESFIFAFIALVFGWIFVELFRPAFNNLTGKAIEIDYGDPVLLSSLLAIFIVTGFLSGSYPALVLSSLPSVNVLKGELVTYPGSRILRNSLVIFQFFISAVLIIGITTIYKQLWYIQHKDLGVNTENLLVVPFTGAMATKYDAIKDELLRNPGILYVTGVSSLPTNVNSHVGLNWEGNRDDSGIGIDYFMADYDLVETMGMEIIAGRSFSEEFAGDDSIAYILNETAVKKMGIDNPIGHPVTFQHPYFPGRFSRGKIIGVVKDFHHCPLRRQIVPLAMRIYRPWYNYIIARINTDDMQGTISYIRETANKFAPDYPFGYSFFEDELEAMYSTEYKIRDIVIYFTALSLLISCLGLFGLASFTAERYTKQIGIRKVNGASVKSIVTLLSQQFSQWIIIGLILSCPVAWFIMNKVLTNYAYRTDLSWWIFILTSVVVLFLGMITVLHQALKAAWQNPADSLRYE